MGVENIKRKIEDQLNISINKIIKWGMFRQIIAEQIIDSNLKDSYYPKAKEALKQLSVN